MNSSPETKILIVDDKEDILLLIKTLLELEGYSIHTASNGDEAITLAKEHFFPLILLDIMMEGKDGIATLKEIRKIQGYADSYIVALTAKAYDNDRIEVLKEGFNDHFPKPFRTQALLDKIKTVLGK